MNLRDELGGLAEQASSYANGDKAVKRAKGRRTRRMIAAPLAIVAVLAVSVPIALQSFGGGKGDDGAAGVSGLERAEYITPAVDGGHAILHTADGRELDIPPFFQGAGAVAVPNGWVLNANQNSADVEGDGAAGLLTRDGDLVMLTGQEGPILLNAVSADGSRIAWLKPDNILHVADITPDGIGTEVTTPVEAGVDTLAWAGQNLLIGQSPTDARLPQRWDVWDPQSGDFEPDWTEGRLEPLSTRNSYGIVSLREEGDTCRVFVSSTDKDELGRRCPTFTGSVLAVNYNSTTLFVLREGDGTLLGTYINLIDYFQNEQADSEWEGCGTGAGMQATWTRENTLLALSGNRLAECTDRGVEIASKQLPEGSRLVLSDRT